ncbi:FUSC family protein [Novosphingobium sp.]|uniref:FUSC family protein n=1 Tax=Novosphingobium sp. TaxID=1874826 RepID=UPI0038BB6635
MRWGPPALYSAKNAVAALAALGISLSVGLPMPFWAMSTVYITSNQLSGATRSKAFFRVIGTALGAAVAVWLVPALVEWPLLLSLALAMWLALCLSLSLLDRSPRAYVVMLAGYTCAIVAFPSVNHPEAVFDTAIARVTEITLGIVCATLTHSLFWPTSVGERLGPKLSAWLDDAETWLGDALQGDARAARRSEQDRRRLAVDAMECILMAAHVPYDTSHWREATRTVQALLNRILWLLPLLSGLADRSAVLGDDPLLAPARGKAIAWLAGDRLSQPVPDFLDGTEPGGADAAAAPRDWTALLRESFLVRLTQACHVIAQSRRLLAHIDDPQRVGAAATDDASGALKLHSDPVFATLSGLSAGFALLLVCGFWIETGWADGGTAAAMTAIYCCMFAAMDNPVPAIIAFGGATIASAPLAGLYLFWLLPQADGFVELTLMLAPLLLVIGMVQASPRWGLAVTAFLVGLCSTLAIQETFDPDFGRFLNSTLAQTLAMLVAATVTALFRSAGAEAAVTRLVGRLRADLAALASATTPPDPAATLSRASDQLALITQRLGADDPQAGAVLRDVRIAMNIATLQHLRTNAGRPLRVAVLRLLRDLADHFAARRPVLAPAPLPARLLARIDRALRLVSDTPQTTIAVTGALIDSEPSTARAALVALRRNLFPDAPAFDPLEPARLNRSLGR